MRFLPAGLLIVFTLVSAPFMGLARDALFSRLGGAAVKTLAILLVLTAAAAFLWGVSQIRSHRLARYGGLLIVFGLLVLQNALVDRGGAQVNVVEKIHIVLYGSLAALFYRAIPLHGRAISLPQLTLPILWAGLTGVAEESVQAFFQLRVGDVHDIGLNLFAAVCGLLFATCLWPPASLRLASPATAWVVPARWTAALLVATGLFLHHAQFGHLVDDPEVGKFRSWFTAEQLKNLGEERQERWRENPPTGLVAWHRKDYYLVEAARHANHRNHAYKNGHWTLAWQANRILERHYDPFLDLTSFRHGAKHRYPPELRAELETKANPDPSTYFSSVQEGRVLLVSRSTFWSILAFCAALLLAVPSALAARRR